jgi:hypothetical protein
MKAVIYNSMFSDIKNGWDSHRVQQELKRMYFRRSGIRNGVMGSIRQAIEGAYGVGKRRHSID